MEETLQERYLDIQYYLWALQQEEWPLEKPSRRDAYNEVVRFSQRGDITSYAKKLKLALDPKKPKQFLLSLQKIIFYIITAPADALEKETSTVPPKEILEENIERLEEARKNRKPREKATVFLNLPLDKNQESIYQTLRQKIKNGIIEPELELKPELVLDERIIEEINDQITHNLISILPPLARKEALSEEDYEGILEQLKPNVVYQLKLIGFEKPRIDTDEKITIALVKNTLPEAREISLVPHQVKLIKEILATIEKPVTAVPFEPLEALPKVTAPKLTDLPFLKWQPTGIKVPPFRTTWAFSKKAMLSPFVKPLQWLIDLAPESFREKNLALVYAASGVTPEATEQTLEYFYKEKPESPEIPFWQGLKAVFKTEEPPFLTLFKHFYEWDYLGKAGTRIKTVGTSRLVRVITFGRFDNFVSLRVAFWRIFKRTRIGGLISRGAGKLISYLPKITRFFAIAAAAVAGWETFKKAGKIFLGYLASLFMMAAHYGPAAVLGLTASLAIGFPFAIKAAIGVGSMVTGFFSFLGPFAIVPGVVSGVITFFVVEAVFAVVGLVGGIGAQMLIDKLGAALSGTSLPQAGTTGLTEASAAASSTASLAMPAAVATAVAGGIIVSQIVSSAFVIPSEEVRLTSPYIEVTKTVEFSGNINDPIKYTIRVKAVDKDLTNVKIVDQPTATCRGTPPDLEEHSWNGSISIPAGETWERTYKVATNDQFNDCLISNTVRITALVEGKTEESFTVGYVSIGNPPEVIPQGLPIHDNPARGNGYTFGQMVPCYEDPSKLCRHQGIDVHGSGPKDVPVYSTFPSKSTVSKISYNARGGWHIILSTGKYQIYMGHLAKRPSLRVGDSVDPFAPVGIQGDSGHAFGAHVHYQIWENGIIVDPRRFGVPSPPW